jgi:alpha-beta hydrolase superfamily lysophospholipase
MAMPRFLYCHGFASGPKSHKGMAFAEHFAAKGVTVDRLNLRVPSFESLRLSAMIDTARAAIGGPDDRAVLVGSSLGGLTAARVAERDPRVIAVMLLAPAFQLIPRWKEQLGPAWDEWQRTGWREVPDFTTNVTARIDFGFAQDVSAVDRGFPDLSIPTLICHGIHDEAVPVEHSRLFAAGRPNVRLIELDDGHELAASLPRLLEEADAFLDPFLR